MGLTDKARNAAEDAMGRAKEAVGKAGGDKETEREGKADQVKANLKKAGENVKDALS